MIRNALRFRRHIATAAAVTYVNLFMVPAAYASGSSMPWEAPLQSILESIEGPVAKIVAVIIIIATGLAFDRAMRMLAVVKRHYRAVMVTGGSMLVLLGLLQVTGVWTELMSQLQTRFGAQNLPL